MNAKVRQARRRMLERSILKWAKKGKDAEEIAAIIGTGNAYVRATLSRLLKQNRLKLRTKPSYYHQIHD